MDDNLEMPESFDPALMTMQLLAATFYRFVGMPKEIILPTKEAALSWLDDLIEALELSTTAFKEAREDLSNMDL